MNRNELSENFDLNSALGRFAQDYELLDEAIAIFKEEAPKHLSAIKKYLELGEFQEASIHAHTLKSECAAVGASKAQTVSLNMEKTAANKDFAQAQEILPELEQEVADAVNFLPDSTKFMVNSTT